MRKIFRIASRDYNAAVRTKGFIIGLIIAPIFMCGGLIAFVLLEDRVDTSDKRIAVIDRSDEGVAEHIVEEAKKRNENEIFEKDKKQKGGDVSSEVGKTKEDEKPKKDEKPRKKVKPAYIIEIVAPDNEKPKEQRLALSERIRNKSLFAFIEIGPSVVRDWGKKEGMYLNYYSENSALSDAKAWLQGVINHDLRLKRGKNLGLEKEQVYDVAGWINVTGLGLVSIDEETGKTKDAKRFSELETIFPPMVMTMLLFLMMLMGATPLMGTVLEEKGQHISEVLLGSVRPFGLMMGKVLGGVAVSLTGMIVYVTVAAVAAHFYENIRDHIPFQLLPWFFFYMIAGIFMFGSLFAAVGAACNDQKEVQSIMPFVMIPMMIPMFVLVPVIKEPTGGFATWLSLIPPCTPMTMMLRQATPTTIPEWQPWVGMAGVALFTIFCIWAGGRIFRIGILMQGKAPKPGELVKWVFKG